MSEHAHTPPQAALPWRANIRSDGVHIIRGKNDQYVCHTENPDHAALIVRAVNSHANMLAMLKRCEAMVSEGAGPPNWDLMREIIAKAEAQP